MYGSILIDTSCSGCCTTRCSSIFSILYWDVSYYKCLKNWWLLCSRWKANKLFFFFLYSENFPGSLLLATTIHHNLCAESNKSASNFGNYHSDDKNNTCYYYEADYHRSKNNSDQHNYSTLGCSTSSSQCLDHCTIQGPDSAERSAEE